MGAQNGAIFEFWRRFSPPNSESGALSAPIQEILLKYSLDLPYIQTGICFIEVFANTPYLQGVHHTHISGDHNDP